MIRKGLFDLEPPWGIEPQTPSLRGNRKRSGPWESHPSTRAAVSMSVRERPGEFSGVVAQFDAQRHAQPFRSSSIPVARSLTAPPRTHRSVRSCSVFVAVAQALVGAKCGRPEPPLGLPGLDDLAADERADQDNDDDRMVAVVADAGVPD